MPEANAGAIRDVFELRDYAAAALLFPIDGPGCGGVRAWLPCPLWGCHLEYHRQHAREPAYVTSVHNSRFIPRASGGVLVGCGPALLGALELNVIASGV